MNKRNILLIVVSVLLGLAVVGGGALIYWANDVAQPMPEALEAMQSDDVVEFSNPNGWLVFQPAAPEGSTSTTPTTGFILYPGGRVDYRAYASVAREIAAKGYLVVVPPMPLNLAFFGSNVAMSVMEAFPQVEKWAIGGHSLGGVAAAGFADSHRDQVDGIVFWASFPAGDMHPFPGQVVSIFGTNDGLATPADIEESKKNLPPTTEFVSIEGGNHAQFGFYGPQLGDNLAATSHAEQQRQVADATSAMLSRLP